jgi:hypothetical protein
MAPYSPVEPTIVVGPVVVVAVVVAGVEMTGVDVLVLFS